MHTDVPRDLLPEVERHLAYAQAMLHGARLPAQETRLHLIAGTLATVAGELSFTLGNPGDAHTHFVAADRHAKEAGDGPLRAYVLSQRSQVYSDAWSGWRDSGSLKPLQLLEEAHAVVGTGSSTWLRAYLLGHLAEEHAIRGDTRAAHRYLGDADRLVGTATSADQGFFAHWDDVVARLVCVESKRGNCAQLLGASTEAATTIEEALAALSPSLVSMRSNGLVDLAMAYAKEGEAEHACGLLAESLDLCSQKGLVAHVRRVTGVRRHLSRWQDTPAVRGLDERLHQITWAPV